MSQVLNTDVIPKLDVVIEAFRSGIFTNMRSGIENARECANKAGAPKLVQSCDAAAEGTDAMIRTLEEMIECAERYKEQLKKVQDALN